MKISEVLDEVLDRLLLFPLPNTNRHTGEACATQFICHLICDVLGASRCVTDAEINELPAVKFLADAGMSLTGDGFSYWDETWVMRVPTLTKPVLRAVWIDLMRQVAIEEGL